MEQQNAVGVLAVAIEWAVHARWPNRPSWPGQTDPVGLFSQETFYIGRRHLAFDGRAADSGGMARAELFGNAEPFAYAGVAGIGSTHLDAHFFKMLDPFVATATVGVFPDFRAQLRCGCRISTEHGRQKQARQPDAVIER